MPASGGEPRILTAGLDRWVDEFRYSRDGEWIYFLYEKLGGTTRVACELRDGRLGAAARGRAAGLGIRRRATGVIAARIEDDKRRAGDLRGRQADARRLTDVNDAYLRSVRSAPRRKWSSGARTARWSRRS